MITFYSRVVRSLNPYRFAKLQYTFALRFAMVVEDNAIEMSFSGDRDSSIQTDRSNEAFKGDLTICGRKVENVVAIAQPKKHGNGYGNFEIVTAWYDSDVVVETNKGGAHIFAEAIMDNLPVCSPAHVAQFSAAYRNGTKGSVEIFQDWHQEQGRNEVSTKYARVLDEEKQRYSEQMSKLREENNKLVEQVNATQKLLEQFRANDNKRLTETIVKAKSQGDEVKFVAVGAWKGIIEGDRYDLLLVEGHEPRKLKWSTFDRDHTVRERAKQIPVGTEVGLTCWDPIMEPGRWSNLGFCRDVIVI